MQLDQEMRKTLSEKTDSSSPSQTIFLSDDEVKLLLRFRLLNKQNKSKSESFIDKLTETQNNT